MSFMIAPQMLETIDRVRAHLLDKARSRRAGAANNDSVRHPR